MFKPWVVYTLLWIYKGGLLFVLVAVVLLGCRRTASTVVARWSQSDLQLVLLGIYAAVGLTGLIIDYTFLTVATGILGIMAYGLCRLTLYGWIPLLIVAWFGLPLGRILLDEQNNEYLPKREVHLASDLVCRAYPKQYDSLTGTRLVLVRTHESWFRDQVVEERSTPHQTVDTGCTLTPDGQVTMVVKSVDGEETVTRKVR